MDNIYILIVIIVPMAMFLSGFLIARQLRVLENVPMYSMMFVKYRWRFSFVIGFVISLLFTGIVGLLDGFTPRLFYSFVGIFLLATFCYYLGASFGWGKSTTINEEDTATHKVQLDTAFPENVLVEGSLSSIRITINAKKRWGFFIMEAFQWIFLGLCGLPILGLLAISFVQNYLPQNLHFLVWVLVGGLILYLLYTKFRETLEYIFDKEIIEIDNMSIRIEKYGSKFNSKKEYSAENIKQITALFSFGTANVMLKRSRFMNSNMDAFIMWHNGGLKRYRTFGRAVDPADAQRIMEMVYAKFPQYKG